MQKRSVFLLVLALVAAMPLFAQTSMSKPGTKKSFDGSPEKIREPKKQNVQNVQDVLQFVGIPGKNYKMLKTEVTQQLYESVMGSNPSENKGENNPVENVSWFDAVYFCNKLSEKYGRSSVYSVNGTTDVTKWGYTPHNGNSIKREIKQDISADGFRLPTQEEWEFAAKGGQNYTYAGSNKLDEVGWHHVNSGNKTHPVAQKKANGYGLYDMSGNVWEWCWDPSSDFYRSIRGGGFGDIGLYCKVTDGSSNGEFSRGFNVGFRIVCTASN